MEVRIQYSGNVKFQVSTRGHEVISDQPASNGGSDTGMTPPELLLGALGSCAAYYAAQYLKNHSLPCEGLEVVVTAEKLKAPARFDNFRIEVMAPGLDEGAKAGLVRAVQACPVHNTLTHPAVFQTVVNTEVPTLA